MKKICIVTHTHLTRNPRVPKEAVSLAKAGYEVIILNSTYSQQLNIEDQEMIEGYGIKLLHVSDLSIVNWRSLKDRLLKKIGNALVQYLRIETSFALGYAPTRYLKICEKLHADLYICHQELPTYLGTKLLKMGFNTAFDLEDWHSEDLLPESRRIRAVKLLRASEQIALQKGIYCSTTSISLANAMAKAYQTKTPAVIYNTFLRETEILTAPKVFNRPLKLFWFSLVIGPGRGLERVVKILSGLDSKIELHLLGGVSDAYKKELRALLPEMHVLHFHEFLPALNLAAKITEFDIGLALEHSNPLNREYTITNKFFQYMESGLPIIATPTVGQKEIFDQYEPGFLMDFERTTPAELELWLNNFEQLQEARNMAIKTAKQYNWDTQETLLINLVQNAISKPKN